MHRPRPRPRRCAQEEDRQALLRRLLAEARQGVDSHPTRPASAGSELPLPPEPGLSGPAAAAGAAAMPRPLSGHLLGLQQQQGAGSPLRPRAPTPVPDWLQVRKAGIAWHVRHSMACAA